MKAIIILGSRNHEGRTARAAGALTEGYSSAGGQCEQVFLPEQAIERCRQCENTGWGRCRAEGSCVIEDDFGDLVTRIQAADVAVDLIVARENGVQIEGTARKALGVYPALLRNGHQGLGPDIPTQRQGQQHKRQNCQKSVPASVSAHNNLVSFAQARD